MRRVIQLLSAATFLLATASCTQNTTRPRTSGSPEFVRVTATTSTALGLSGSGATTLATSGETSAYVTAAEGGTVTAGRYTVAIPAGALEKDRKITVKVDEVDGFVGCELLPHGIKFAAPVRLIVDLTGTSFTAVEPVSIYWYDTSTGEWVDVGGTFDSTTLQLWTDLPHFSEYRAGRVGW